MQISSHIPRCGDPGALVELMMRPEFSVTAVTFLVPRYHVHLERDAPWWMKTVT